MLYFAYGMNLDPSVMPDDCTPVGPGRLDGWELQFSFFANVVENDGASCIGAVWEFPDDSDVLRMLDSREGYPRLYDRRTVKVQLPWDEVEATVYFMRDPGGRSAPTLSYLEMLLNGRAFFGLGTDDLSEPLQVASNHDRIREQIAEARSAS